MCKPLTISFNSVTVIYHYYIRKAMGLDFMFTLKGDFHERVD